MNPLFGLEQRDRLAGELQMRGTAFQRQLRLLQMLENRQFIELDEAASELRTRKRTVYRDLEVLEQSGVPVYSEKEGRHARWKIVEGYRHRLQLSLTWSELLGLVVARDQLAGLEGTALHGGAASAIEKIRATLPRPLAERFALLGALASAQAGGRDYRHRSPLLLKLVEAIELRRTIDATYRSTGTRRATGRRLNPLHLHVLHDSIYVLAFCHRVRRVKTYALDRFDAVELTDETFAPPEDFDPRAFLAPSFLMWGAGQKPRRVRFVVSRELGTHFMEKKIHPSQVAQARSDGSVEVQLNVVSSPALEMYLCSLGEALLEVEPVELKQAVRGRHERAALQLQARVTSEGPPAGKARAQ